MTIDEILEDILMQDWFDFRLAQLQAKQAGRDRGEE